MARRKPSTVRAGPNPRDQREEREARIGAILERLLRYRGKTDVHQQHAEHHQAAADRLTERATRRKTALPGTRTRR
ncbi:MAG TPA: hypothetical protein VHJ58_02545 [Vicinamibacterales bacterium]|nr:hypothetical protein [Vicinamibacterales bacterium]